MSPKGREQATAQEGASARAGGERGLRWNWATFFKVLIVVILLVWPVVYRSASTSQSALNIMCQAGYYAVITLAVGLVLGQAGQLSFGHSAFMGIGAYACGLLIYKGIGGYHFPTLLAWIIGALVAGGVALIIGRPVLKLKYFYLALATLGFGQIFIAFTFEYKPWGAANGFAPVDRLTLFGFEFGDYFRKYYLVWVVVILILLFLARLLKYRVGRALRALSVSEIASSTLGVRNADWKLKAFVWNAVFCGVAGGLFAFIYGAVDPHNFSFAASVLPIVMMLIGGDRWIWGAILGSVIMTWVMNVGSGALLQYNGVVYSLVMILLLLFLPAGILGLRSDAAKRWWARIKGETLEERPVTVVPGGAAPGGTGAALSGSGAGAVSPDTEGIVLGAEAYSAGEYELPREPKAASWAWVWMLPVLLLGVAFVVMNSMAFLTPVGANPSETKALTKALKAVTSDEGRLILVVGLPLIAALALCFIRRWWFTLMSALISLGIAVYLIFLMREGAGILGVEGRLDAGWGLILGMVLTWIAFAAAAVACVQQIVQARQEVDGETAVAEGTAQTKAESAVAPPGIAGEAPLLRIENVSVHFGGLKAVSEVSFDVKEGSITALIGPNGAGKTTLFNAVSRLQQMAGGRIFFKAPKGTDLADALSSGEKAMERLRGWFGRDAASESTETGFIEVTKLEPASMARLGTARTFQNLRIFVNMTVLDNVLVGCHRHERSGFWAGGLGFPSQKREEKASRSRALGALALVGLRHKAELPASSLPYGQQRLVEIARALASQPRLLLLDEPAAGMNQGEREDLVARIATIRRAGVTVLLVEHDVDLVMDISDAVNVLDYGKLIAKGAPEQMKKDPAVIAAYLGAEHGVKDLCATRALVDGEECPVTADMLVVEDLVTSYGSIEALHGVSLTVPKGMVVAVLGANGAGKSTLLHTISGIVRPQLGRILYEGVDVTKMAPHDIVSKGLCQVPEGRQLFPTLSVEDNLVVGASGRRDRSGLADDIAYAYDLFPVLGERRRQLAGTLSGGEQQMLAICRALTGQPRLLLLDEPSMGLAPLAVERIFEALAKLNERGITMLMVEQNAQMALSLAHLAVVLQTGGVVLSGTATQLRQDDRVRASYLGE